MWSGKCPVGEMSIRGNVLVGKCPVGKVSFGEVSGWGIVRSGKCQLGNFSRGSVSRGTVPSGNYPHTDIHVTLRIWVPYRFKKPYFSQTIAPGENLTKSLRTWQKKFKVFKDLKISGVSGFSFWAIDPIRKDRNDGKFNLISVAN